MQEVQSILPVGSVIRERYVVESVLGKGGFGVVYRVSDLRVKGNQYALKEVIESHGKDRTRKDKNHFTFEGDVLKRLDHRALPRVYRAFDDDAHERSYILMDFVDGPNLDDEVAEAWRCPAYAGDLPIRGARFRRHAWAFLFGP